MDPEKIESTKKVSEHALDEKLWNQSELLINQAFNPLTYNFTVEPTKMDSLISDVGNFSVCIFILLLAKAYKLINFRLLILSCLMMLTPFLLNNSVVSWDYFPDQSKYLLVSKFFRDNMVFNVIPTIQDAFLYHAKVKLSAFIFAYVPLLSIETFKSIGFINRILFVGTFLFFITRNYLPLYAKILLIFSPSIIIYSSISLRDNLILMIMIWLLYFFLKRSYILLIIFGFVLYAIKIQNFLICVLAFYIIIMFDNKYPKLIRRSMKTLSIIGISIGLFFYTNEIMETLNSVRLGLYSEHNGYYQSKTAILSYVNLAFDKNLIIIFFSSMARFVFSPLQELKTIPYVILFVETLIIYILLFKAFYEGLKIKNIKKITKIWIFMFFLSLSTYAMFIFNHGAITRYRFVLLFFIIIGYETHKYFHLKSEAKKI